MIKRKLCLSIHMCLCVLIAGSTYADNTYTDNILESFTVTTHNAEVREFTRSSIQLRSDSNAYTIKLEPNKTGEVIFSLSGIGYATTVRVSPLLFGVEITGYCGDEEMWPIFSRDDVNRDLQIIGNTLRFERLYGPVPVWFDRQVDSINLQFSNSLGLDINQYLAIQDLRILQSMEVTPNPQINPCGQNTIMIAIDGSSSIDKNERTIIGNRILEFVRKSGFAQDSHALCIMEYGTDIHSIVESSERRTLVRVLKKYRRDRNHKSDNTSWTNWSAPFDEAIRRKPDILIFITDGWSNWDGGGPASFSAQYMNLFSRANTLKANGTRLLFVTSDIDTHNRSGTILSNFLDGDSTCEVTDLNLTSDTSLGDVDLVTMKGFEKMSELDFSSMLQCPELPDEQILQNDIFKLLAMVL